MNRLRIIAVGLLVAGILVLFFISRENSPMRSSSEVETAQTDYQELLQKWITMWNRTDLSAVDRIFLPDGRVSYFSSEIPGLIRGIEALREHHRGFGFGPGGGDPESELSMSDVEGTVFGPVTVVTGTWHFRKKTEKTNPQSGPVTFVFIREAERIRIAHAHFADQPGVE